MLPNEGGMLSERYEKCLCSQEGFTLRPRPERTTKESMLPSCICVRRWDSRFWTLFIGFLRTGTRFSSVYVHMLKKVGFFFFPPSRYRKIWGSYDLLTHQTFSDFHFLWERTVSHWCSKQKIYKNTTRLERKRYNRPHHSPESAPLVQAHYIWCCLVSFAEKSRS